MPMFCLVSGPVSDAMRLPLRKTYEAMPEPKRVVAIGACAIFGGVFGPSFAASGGAAEIFPVDVVVPGCPPPPLGDPAWAAAGRRTKAAGDAGLHRARASHGAGMSTIAQLFRRILYPLRDRSGRRASDSAAMEFDCPCRDWLALRVLISAGKRPAAGRRSRLSEPTLWPVLSLGTIDSGGRSRFPHCSCSSPGWYSCRCRSSPAVYLEKYREHYSLRYFSVLYHALFASIVLVLIADDAISFLVAWEIMSIASYLLVNFEYEREESSRAGFVMLAMSEAGTIAVAMAFILIAGAPGGLGFRSSCDPPRRLSEAVGWAVFLLSFFGFAVKAGPGAGQ